MSIHHKVLDRIKGKGRGWVFTPSDFLNLGSRDAVDQSLSRLARQGVVRRLGRGIYDYPRHHKRLGMLSPSADAIAQAVVPKDKGMLQVSGARAANVLGLTTQVPAQPVYLTDGYSKRITVDGRVIHFRHAARRNLVGGRSRAGMVFQAIRYLGKDRVDDSTIQRLHRQLPDDVKSGLRRDLGQMTDWMRTGVDQITLEA